MTQVAQKMVSVIARVEFKKNGIVVYRVASSSGHNYNVTVFAGNVSSCIDSDGNTCKGWQYRHSCHHTDLVAAKEAERVEMERRIEQDLTQHVEDDLRFNPWHGSNYGAERLSREEYTAEFGIY